MKCLVYWITEGIFIFLLSRKAAARRSLRAGVCSPIPLLSPVGWKGKSSRFGMNLFCFSLEGSTDSLYEAPEPGPDPTPWSPVWGESEPGVAPELLQTSGRQCKTDLKEEKRKSRASELTGIDDITPSSNVYCPCTGKGNDLVYYQAEDATEDPYMMNHRAQKEKTDKHERDYGLQTIEDKTHLQKREMLVKSSVEQSRCPPDISEDSTVITCIGLVKKPTKKLRKESNQQPETGNERDNEEMDSLWNPGHFHHNWSTMDACSFWELSHHSCHRPTVDPWLHNVNFTLPRGTDRHWYEELIHDLDLPRMEYPSQRIIRSFTDLNMTDTMRSYSFGKFDTSKNQSGFGEHENTLVQDANGDSAEGDHVKGGLGKKMKAISLTMRKKMGKKYSRALSEETGEGVDRNQEAEGLTATEAPAKDYTKSSNPVESLFSLPSSQSSSSSGITSVSEGPCNRNSLRLEEEVLDTIHFCGKAKVHTDFLPSPYDTESLKLKVGDVINIISKPPMGIWTGMLNGKVGSFKFIYVDILHEEPAPVHRTGNHRRSRRPRPKTLQEFLERLNLEEFMSSLLLNGYQTVEDLKDLKEQHLIELNVTDPEQRHKLLAATECLHDTEVNSQKGAEGEEVPKSPSVMMKVEPDDCPRDSGCYVVSDYSDNGGKEDAESLLPAPLSTSPAEA